MACRHGRTEIFKVLYEDERTKKALYEIVSLSVFTLLYIYNKLSRESMGFVEASLPQNNVNSQDNAILAAARVPFSTYNKCSYKKDGDIMRILVQSGEFDVNYMNTEGVR